MTACAAPAATLVPAEKRSELPASTHRTHRAPRAHLMQQAKWMTGVRLSEIARKNPNSVQLLTHQPSILTLTKSKQVHQPHQLRPFHLFTKPAPPSPHVRRSPARRDRRVARRRRRRRGPVRSGRRAPCQSPPRRPPRTGCCPSIQPSQCRKRRNPPSS